MTAFRRTIQVLGTIAIMLMAWGHLQQVIQATDCAECHSEKAATDSDACPSDHVCAHCHALVVFALSDETRVPTVSIVQGVFSHADETCADGPCREIDYPPQLA